MLKCASPGLDELLTDYLGYLITKARFTLRSIEYRDKGSCPAAYYFAARAAVNKIVCDNVVWPWEQGEAGGSESTRDAEGGLD
jgi:hypothetical protein